MPVVLQVPVGVRGEPVVAVAVEDDLVLVGDPTVTEEATELLRLEKVALDLVLEVQTPVESDRARDVTLTVERRILVDFDDSDRVVVQVLLEPLGLDQNFVCILSHGFAPACAG